MWSSINACRRDDLQSTEPPYAEAAEAGSVIVDTEGDLRGFVRIISHAYGREGHGLSIAAGSLDADDEERRPDGGI
jgi:hypothetical protein